MYQGKYASQQSAEKPKKKATKATVGTKVFYSVYAAVVVLCIVGIFIGLNALNDWLVSYEASQPDTKSQQVFDSLFAQPDWKNIYAVSGMENTKFESANAFAAYMTEKVGTDKLTYNKTSAGLSGGHKYLVKHNGENIAAFTLQNREQSELALPQWEMDTLEVFLKRTGYVSITAQPGSTVTVNGVALDESYIVRTTSTLVEDYLPEGMHGAKTVTYYVDGLLTIPKIAITDESGAAAELHCDETGHDYSQMLPDSREIGDDQLALVKNAAQAYCRHMIGAGSGLSTYFDTSSAIYKSITRNELWFGGYTGYNFSDITVSDFYPYSDSLYSARVSLTLNVTRADGSVKKFEVDNTFFVEKKSNGAWKIIDMTNVDVQQEKVQVRLTYMQDGNVLSSEMVDATAGSVTTPTVTAPEGKVLSGWFREVTGEDGKTTMVLVFAPDETGKVNLPSGYELEPMVLHALFDNEGA